MILAFDIGNTFAKWGFVHDGAVVGGGRALHRGRGLDAALADLAPERRPQRIVAVNVAGESAAFALRGWSQARWGLVPEFVDASTPINGVRSMYRNPSRLGADRWAALVGAFHVYGASLVADLGTAATLDVIDAAGVHRGGYIVPGVDAMRRALGSGTAAVNVDDIEVEPGSWGLDTEACVAAGGRRVLASLIEAAAREFASPGVRLVLTGGDAERVAPWVAVPHRIDHDLVLCGAARLAEGHGS